MRKIIMCKRCNQLKLLHAKGLCHNCYQKQLKRQIITCEICGKLKPHHSHGLCQTCYGRERSHQKGIHQPMDKDKTCTSYLGIVVAEQVLSKVFKDVQRMPNGNPGYDFICRNDYKIDVKSATQQKNNRWQFVINKNQIPDYFALLAFDNRKDLNPIHFWIIPGNRINNKVSISISSPTINKWCEYEQSLDKVLSCCNAMKQSNK